jgi:signal transduction histidine kinase
MSRSKLIFVLVAVLGLPVATVTWLALRLVDLDRALEAQREAESRERVADRAVQALAGMISDPAITRRQPSNGALVAVIPGGRLLFHPRVAPLPEGNPLIFEQAERLEILEDAQEQAAARYRSLAQSEDALVRAGALLRLARTLRRSKYPEEAFRVYAELERFESAGVGGWPAPLAAAWGRCTLLEAVGREHELTVAATRLRAELNDGKWPLTRAAYEAFASDVERWTGLPRPRELELLTEALNRLELTGLGPQEPAFGARVIAGGSDPITVVWRRTGDRLAAFAATAAYVEREWLPRVGNRVWLTDDTGRNITSPHGEGRSIRYAAQTSLPWTVVVATPPRTPEFTARSRLLVLLLTAVGLFSAAGGYVVFRALLKEFALARMKEDFVAAVSHEFRTPLTSLRQITESLEDGRVGSEEHREAYYRSLSRATRRLHRLVEDLLDFRRMQSGATEYRKSSFDANALVSDVVASFKLEVQDQGFRIGITRCDDASVVADREAISRALWNLLDNAVKYSGDSRDIQVSVACTQATVEVSVRDGGMGIQLNEQSQVFGRFYRGYQARTEGIRGTGIGLAMVKQILEAHGGRVSLHSQPGEGSTFTLAVPREENGWRAS